MGEFYIPKCQNIQTKQICPELPSGKSIAKSLPFQTVMCLLTCAQGQAPRRNNDTSTFSEKP